jgi:hypothetical protein
MGYFHYHDLDFSLFYVHFVYFSSVRIYITLIYVIVIENLISL